MQNLSLVTPPRRPSSARGKLIPYLESEAATCDTKLKTKSLELESEALRKEAKIDCK